MKDHARELVKSLGTYRDAERKTGVPKATIGRFVQAPWSVGFEHARLLASPRGDSLDWLAAHPVSRQWRQREQLSGELTAEGLETAMQEVIARSPLASQLGENAWRFYLGLVAPRGVLEWLTEQAQRQAEVAARRLVADRLATFAWVLENLVDLAPKHAHKWGIGVIRLARGARLNAQDWRLRSAALRMELKDEGNLWRYLADARAEIPTRNGSLSTRFPVPGGVAWAYRGFREDTVIFFGDGFASIRLAQRPHAKAPLLRDDRLIGRGEASEEQIARWMARNEEDRAALPPEDSEVLWSLEAVSPTATSTSA